MAELTPTTEHELRARIAELEALLEARTQTIVGMGARLAELQGDAPPAIAERLRVAEAELAQLRATKVVRYSAVPRRVYGVVRRTIGG
jgi:ribosomal protein L29